MNEEKLTPLEEAFWHYIQSGRQIAAKNAEIEHMAHRIATETHYRNELVKMREDAFAVMQAHLTPDAIAELKAVQP